MSLCFRSNDFIIVSVGRLRTEKGFQTIIKAIKELPENYKLLIIGDGPVFVGNKDNVERYLKVGDLYVSASHSEGFGLTIIEAAAAGLPILASNISAFRELLPQNQLFPIDNSHVLSDLIYKHKYTQCNNIITEYSFGIQFTRYYLNGKRRLLV